MTTQSEDELGAVDWVVIDFPPDVNPFEGPMAKELAVLVESELVRVLDLMVVTKEADGSVDVVEYEDLEDAGPLAALEGSLAEVLALEDVEHVAEDMPPGSSAVVIVWENSWSAPFAAAARSAGGQLVGSGRIPTQALIAAIETDADSQGD